jgi:hypothetical protein
MTACYRTEVWLIPHGRAGGLAPRCGIRRGDPGWREPGRPTVPRAVVATPGGTKWRPSRKGRTWRRSRRRIAVRRRSVCWRPRRGTPLPRSTHGRSLPSGGSPAASLRRLPPGPGVSRVPELAGLRVCGTAGPRPPGLVGSRYPGPWNSRASSHRGSRALETAGIRARNFVVPRACDSEGLWAQGTTILGPPDASGSQARGIASPRARGLQGGRSPGPPGPRD